jgi:hypothetical protein
VIGAEPNLKYSKTLNKNNYDPVVCVLLFRSNLKAGLAYSAQSTQHNS